MKEAAAMRSNQLIVSPVCPYCANILTIATGERGGNRLECRTCPFVDPIDPDKPLYSRKTFERQEREDVFGGPGAWDNAEKSKVQCPADGCRGGEAAFFQVQIRSADEPMTTFYKVGSADIALGTSMCATPANFLVVHDVW
jgi:DNA-directed RNA polymerase III subunit RPC11